MKVLGESRFRHDHGVEHLTLLPDALLTASGGLEVRLWSLDGQPLGKRLRLTNPGSGVSHKYSLSSVHPWIAAADARQPGLWDVSTHELLLPLPDIITVRISPDSRWLAHAHKGGLTLWDLECREPLWREELHPDVNVAPVFTADSEVVIVPTGPNWLRIHIRSRERSEFPYPRVWVETACTRAGELVAPESSGEIFVDGRALQAHTQPACAVAVDGDRVVTAGWDGRVLEWDRNWQVIREFRHPGARCVALRGDLLAVGGERHDVSLFRQGEPVFTPSGGWAVTALVYRDQVISAGEDALIRCWGDGRVLEATGPVISMAMSPDGRWLAAGSGRGLRVWDLAAGTNVELQPAGDSIGRWERGIGTSSALGVTRRQGDLGFSADSRRLTALLIYDKVATWSLEDGRLLELSTNDDLYYASATAVTPDGHLVAGEIHLKVWPEEVRVGRYSAACALNVLGDRVAGATRKGEILTWTLPNRDLRKLGREEGLGVRALLLLPDGRVLTSSADGRLRLWPGGPEWEPRSRVTCLALSPDGTHYACGHADGTVWTEIPVPA